MMFLRLKNIGASNVWSYRLRCIRTVGMRHGLQAIHSFVGCSIEPKIIAYLLSHHETTGTVVVLAQNATALLVDYRSWSW